MNEKQHERSKAAIRLAVSRIGSVTKTANALNVTRATVYNWIGGHYEITAANAQELSEVSDIPKADFRPDLWGE